MSQSCVLVSRINRHTGETKHEMRLATPEELAEGDGLGEFVDILVNWAVKDGQIKIGA